MRLLVGPVGLYIRSRMIETPEFRDAVKPPTVPIGELLHHHPIPVMLALGASIISNSSYYLLLYIPTYAVKTLHLLAYTGFAATLLGGVMLAFFQSLRDICPIGRYGRASCWLWHGYSQLRPTPHSG